MTIQRALLISAFCLGPLAGADAGTREKLEDALSRRDLPKTAQFWAELGPDAPATLVSLFAGAPRLHHQVRVLEALRFYSDPQVGAFLKKQAAQNKNATLRRTALRSLVLSQGEKEKPFFDSLMASPDPHTRLAAAESVQLLGDLWARKAVSDFLAQETVGWVVARLQKPATLQSLPGTVRRVLPGTSDPRR